MVDFSTSENQLNGNQQTKIKETAPDDASKYNPSTKFSFNASNQIVKIEKTVGGVTKTQTTDVTDQTIISTITYSAWS